MENSKFREKFRHLAKNIMNVDEVIAFWNEYAAENCPEDMIYDNNEVVVNNTFNDVWGTLCMATNGCFNPLDKYIWYNSNVLVTSDWLEDMPIDFDALADYVQKMDDDLLLNYGVSKEDIDNLFERVDKDEEDA